MAATTITRATLTDSTSPSTGDIWNAALVGTAIYDKVDLLFTGSTLRQERSSSGQVSFTVASASNTSGSDAILQAVVAGTSGGDAQVTLVITSGSTWSIGVDNSDSDFLKITNSSVIGANTFVIDTAGQVFIGDSSNADVTTGLTINQGASDNSIVALKSSDVTHGITTVAETDTFAYFAKASPTEGGLLITALSEGNYAQFFRGAVTTTDATRSTAALAPILLDGALKSGTNLASLGADKNIVVIRDNGTTRFILDSDGDSHQDVGTAWTNFDEHDDIALLTALSGAVSRKDDPLRESFGGWLQTHRGTLERSRIVTINDQPGEDGSVFINWSRAQMLMVGAVRQLAARLDALEAAS